MALRRPGLAFALLALLVQVWLGAAAPVAPPLELASAFCGTDAGAGHPPGTTGHGPGHGLDCALCPACATLAHHAPLVPDPPALPPWRSVAVLGAMRPMPLRAEPHRVSSAQPRAPPVLA